MTKRMQLEPGNINIRRADVRDTDIVVRILIASKEASFPDTIDDHDRDVAFWSRRWRDYIVRGRLPFALLGDGWVFLAEVEGTPVGYIAYHHTRRLGTDAELQNIYILREWQDNGIGTRLLGVVAHRLAADGSRSMCVGYDSNSPYKRFYLKHGAVETSPGAAWSIWHDIPRLASRLPPPPAELMIDLRGQPRCLRPAQFRRFSALLLAVAASCGDGPAPPGEGAATQHPPPIEFHDSAGVKIATVRVTPETPHWRIDPEPELILGKVEGERSYLFSRPEFAACLSDGRVVVADFASGELRWFDADGGFIRRIGRKGEGPWEFREFNRVVRLPGDTLVIYDRVNLRVTRVAPDGSTLDMLSLRETFTTRLAARWWPLERPEFRIVGSGSGAQLARWRNLLFAGAVAGGEHAIGFNSPGTLPPPRQVDTIRARASIVRVGAQGEWGVLAELPGTLQIPRWIDQPPPRGTMAVRRDVPFAHEPLLAARGGPLVVSETGSYEVRVYDRDGVLVRIIRRGDVAQRRVTRDLIDRFVAWMVGRPGSMIEGAVRDWAATSFELAGETYHLPTHAELYLDAAGRIWIEDWRFPWDEREPRTFTVFAPEGPIVATTTVPPELSITDIGVDHVTGVVWGDSGVEYVHVYPIRR
jgi:GNAT superfamily N-acetyltransferase